MRKVSILTVAVSLSMATLAAGSTATLLAGYQAKAATENPAFKGFSAERGQAFYSREHVNPEGRASSCASCHLKPSGPGRTRANKVLQPLSPVTNPARLQDSATVEKWFLRNCSDVLQRECTAQEKGDFITFLQTQR